MLRRETLTNYNHLVVNSHLEQIFVIKMRPILSYIARKLFKEQFKILRSELAAIYPAMEITKNLLRTKILIDILVSGEDHRFKYHIGFDLIAIARAIKNRIIYNKIEGASTIEQQLVRVLTNDYEKTIIRKVREILLSTTLSDLVPRNQIPLIYLNIAYYGANMNGLNQALKRLNTKNQTVINEDLAAEIISRIKYPEPKAYNETRNKQISRRKIHLLGLYKKHKSRKILTIYD
jgi:membrane carboxypeptidase/penicillin-binding protein